MTMNVADFEHPIDVSEAARALGEANCKKWLPGFMVWAKPRIADLELLLIAAHCDGFRAGMKAKMPKTETEKKADRIARWHAERFAQKERQNAHAALRIVDLAQESDAHAHAHGLDAAAGDPNTVIEGFGR